MEARPSLPTRRTALAAALLLAAALGLGCASAGGPARPEPAGRTLVYLPPAGDSLLDRFAPAFAVERAEEDYNRIGTPSAELEADGSQRVFVDPAKPTVYRRVESFESQGRTYRNLIYRVHFQRSPFSWHPFNAGWGRNVGVFAIVTVDDRDLPVFFTTVATCGCYHAILPTRFTPAGAYPEGWKPEGLRVYGETLPAVLDYPEEPDRVRPVVWIRSGSHRVMDVALADPEALERSYPVREMATAGSEQLRALPLAGSGGDTTSFVQEDGAERGLVKGARKPIETLLFGLWVQDFNVGRDRLYGAESEVGQLFYTSLNPFRKRASDMADFPGFLRLNGWRP